MTISVPSGMGSAPPERPDVCHQCGSPVYGKGDSGYYDVCDECHEMERTDSWGDE